MNMARKYGTEKLYNQRGESFDLLKRGLPQTIRLLAVLST